ncbi:MAG TPA: inner membrane CreD family protein, partial [Povalibacter sp.]
MAIRFGDTTSIGAKILLIGVIILLLLIPLMMLRGVVSERSSMREQAYQKVAEGWGGDLVVGGPILVIPTEREVSDGVRTSIERREIYLLPAQQNVDVQLRLEEEPRYVGIYAVPVYLSSVHITGQFDFTSLLPLLDQSGVTYLWKEARLRLPLSEVRSLREVRQARFAGQDIKLGPGTRGLYVGVEAPIEPTTVTHGEPVSFEFVTTLAGSRTFSVLPLGSTTTVTLTSDWPHPSFQGAFLPVERAITATGFQARWQVLELNRSYGQAWTQGDFDGSTLTSSAFGVGLYQ